MKKKISNIGITSRGRANLATFVALVIPEGAGRPNANTYVNGSQAQAYARDLANAAATIRAAFIPTHDLMGGDEAWERADRAAPATADAGIAANNNNPIVFPGIKPGQALYWLRTQFPTILDEKKLLRDLLTDNIFEAERFHNLNPDDLVKHLRNLKWRRAEMSLGLQDRNRQF
ncbi:unnamed protein product [Rhizophagus irregularis]|nr:unnamed protein product [Rhizophagus irregularis]